MVDGSIEDISDAPDAVVPGEESMSGGADDRDVPDLSLKTPGLAEGGNKLKVELADDAGGTDQSDFYSSQSTFEDLGLSNELLQGLYNEMGFKSPSGIQAMTLPLIMAPPHRHLIAQGHNGCGKTTCFALAMLSRVDAQEPCPQAICMCPTRELVVQNLEVIRKMGKYTGVSVVGVNELRIGRSLPPIKAQIVIGTAGKITNLISSRKLILDTVRVLVFDEADEMMKVDGFKDTSVRMIQDVRKASDSSAQILLFSATFDESVKSYVSKIMPSANKVFVEKEQLSLDVIKQYRVDVRHPGQKDEILQEYILKNADKLGQTIIFVASRRTAQNLYQSMLQMGAKCLKLSGDMAPEARDDAVRAFRAVHAKILIATDVIARGFDVSTVTLVINYDLPVNHQSGGPAFDTYLHRIGRSGRFGRKGAAFNFVNTERAGYNHMPDVDIIDEISKYFNRQIPTIPADDEEAFIKVLEDAGLCEKDEDI